MCQIARAPGFGQGDSPAERIGHDHEIGPRCQAVAPTCAIPLTWIGDVRGDILGDIATL